MPAPIVLVTLTLTCPTCNGEGEYLTDTDEETPEPGDTCHCHYCDENGLRKVLVPARAFLHAYRKGRTDEQAYDELAGAINQFAAG